MTQQLLEIVFPTGGLDRKVAARQQRPFTTPDCLNVRPRGTLEQRERGGSRPGLDRTFYEQVGGGVFPIVMGNTLNVAQDNIAEIYVDNFDGPNLSTAWTAASWVTDGAPQIYSGDAGVDRTANADVGAYQLLSDLNVSSAYSVALDIAPYKGRHHGAYAILLRMNDSTPDANTDVIEARLSLTGSTGAFASTLKEVASAVVTQTAGANGSDGAALPGRFEVTVDGNVVTGFWRGRQLFSKTVSAPAGKTVGFEINCTKTGGVCLVDRFRAQWAGANTVPGQERIVVASANGEVWMEKLDQLGTLKEITPANATLSTDRYIQSFEFQGKLYCLDHGDSRLTSSTGNLNGPGTTLTDLNVADFTALGIDINDHVVELVDVTGAAVAGVYPISAITSINLTLARSATDGASPGGASYRILRAPKVIDPIAETVELWTASSGKGGVPVNGKTGARYRGRAVIAVGRQWYMSRQFDFHDWLYNLDNTDLTRPTFATGTLAGVIPDTITAIMPHSDDYLVFATRTSLWLLRGDPAAGGEIDSLSYEVGCVHRAAWCYGPEGELFFVGLGGLYYVAPGASSRPQLVSQGRIPNELRNLSDETHDIHLAYDIRRQGFLIHVRPHGGGGTNWFVKWNEGTFWPEQFSYANHEAGALIQHRGSRFEEDTVLVCGQDGYIRHYDDSAPQDDGKTMNSYVLIGAIDLGRNGASEGILSYIDLVLDENSAAVDLGVVVSPTWDGIVSSSPHVVRRVTDEESYAVRAKARGVALAIKLSNGQYFPWAVDACHAMVRAAGRRRRPD